MDKYIIESTIGSGNYGEVLLVRSKENGARFVIKRIDLSNKTPQQQRDAENEVRTMAKLNHPNIVAFIEAFVIEKKLHIVMEYADGEDLEKMLVGVLSRRQSLPEEQIMRIFVQIVLGLRQVHRQHLLHRDLKSANIFLTASGGVKLGDFGFSKQLNYTMALASTVCGTPYYFCPEICQKLPYNNKSDVWALGVILYEMINLRKPFEAKNLPELRRRVVTEEPAPFTHPAVSDELRDLTLALLRKSSSARPSVEAILQIPSVRRFLTENFSTLLRSQEHSAQLRQRTIIESNPCSPGEGRGGAATAAKQQSTGSPPSPPPVQAHATGAGEDEEGGAARSPAAVRGLFGKDAAARMFKGEVRPEELARTHNAPPRVPQPPPGAAPVMLHNRPMPQVRGKVSANAPLTIVGELTGAVLDAESSRALQDDVHEVLSSVDMDEALGEAESDEELMLRGELGSAFVAAIQLAVELSALDPAAPQSEVVLRQLLGVLGSKQYLLSDVQRVAAFFELND